MYRHKHDNEKKKPEWKEQKEMDWVQESKDTKRSMFAEAITSHLATPKRFLKKISKKYKKKLA